MKRLILLAILMLVCAAIAVTARTIIVAADSSGDFFNIMDAVPFALFGDTVLVRNGEYWGVGQQGEEFTVDSGVVLLSEHFGSASIFLAPGSNPIELFGTSQICGFIIQGNEMGIGQFMVTIFGGPGTITFCDFRPAARWGVQLTFATAGRQPHVEHCRFYPSGSNWIAGNDDTTNICMPNNYYGSRDTVWIHRFIHDHFFNPDIGAISISPLADTFQWSSARINEGVFLRSSVVILYPNPSFGMLNLGIRSADAVDQVQIYDILGREVWAKRIGSHDHTGDISVHLSLPTGNYWILLGGRKRTISCQRVVVIR
jgi:hypothetical protein